MSSCYFISLKEFAVPPTSCKFSLLACFDLDFPEYLCTRVCKISFCYLEFIVRAQLCSVIFSLHRAFIFFPPKLYVILYYLWRIFTCCTLKILILRFVFLNSCVCVYGIPCCLLELIVCAVSCKFRFYGWFQDDYSTVVTVRCILLCAGMLATVLIYKFIMDCRLTTCVLPCILSLSYCEFRRVLVISSVCTIRFTLFHADLWRVHR